MTSIRKFLSRAALGAFVASLFFASASHAQVRQTQLFIDDGAGNFNILKAATGPQLGGVYLFPSIGGTNTLITTGNLSAITGSSFTQGGVFYATSTTAMGTTAAGTANQVLISNGTSAPSWSFIGSSNITPGTDNTFLTTDGSGNVGFNTLDVDGVTLTGDGSSTALAIKSTYAGQASITTLGTIGTGIWQGTAVALGYGGTGVDGTNVTQNEVFASPDGTSGPASFRALTNNDLPSGGSITINTGTGLSGGGAVAPGGSLTLANTGVTSNIAGAGISVSGATGDVTIGNTGTLSVSGTTNEIDVTSGQNPVVSIDGSYAGQASITTLGTIGTGTWQGTAVALGYGGTGVDGTNVTQNEVFASPDGTSGPASFRALTNGDLPSGGSITINTGTGLSGGGAVAPGGSLTLANTGVTSNIAGTGISVSGATGDVTIGNTGTLTVSGTTNEIDVTSGQNPVVSIDAGYVGQSSITTLGTIGTGTWQGTAVALGYGGTGVDGTNVTKNEVFASPDGTSGPASFRALTNGDLPSGGSITINTGTGLSGGGAVAPGGSLTLANTGVTSNIAGTGISVSGATGDVTIGNTGTLTVSGTTNEIDVTSGQNPAVSIDAGYVGQSSITTLGTIGTGIWQGTAVALGYGGTGVDGTNVTKNEVFASPDGTSGPASFRALTNGDLPSGGSITINTGTGLSGGGAVAPGGSLTLANTGVTSNIAGTGISVSGATGDVTIGNTGTLTVSGTTNEIDVTSGQNPVVSIDGSYAGQASITTLGTIGTGTWQGTAVALGYGGTGVDGTNVTKNEVFASPDGTSGPASFRGLVTGDIPDLSGSYIDNSSSPQASSNFNISGSGTIGGTLNVNDIEDGVSLTINTGAGKNTSMGNLTGTTTITASNWSVDASGNGSFVELASSGNTTLATTGTTINTFGSGGSSTNSFGSGGTSINNFGTGGSSTNNFGTGGTATNNFGTGGTAANTIGSDGTSTTTILGGISVGINNSTSSAGSTNIADGSGSSGSVGIGNTTGGVTITSTSWSASGATLTAGSSSLAGALVITDGNNYNYTLEAASGGSASPVFQLPAEATGTYTLATTADIPAGSNYIQNQTSGAQTADFWISGTGTVEGTLSVTDIEGYASSTVNIAESGDLALGNNGATTTLEGAVTADGTVTFGVGSGNDIKGTAGWNVANTGDANFLSIGLGTAGTGAFTTLSASGVLTASTGNSGIVFGTGSNATTLSSTASSARAISFPDAAGTLALTSDVTNAVTTGTIGQLAIYTGTNAVGSTNLSGDVTTTNSAATSIASSAGNHIVAALNAGTTTTNLATAINLSTTGNISTTGSGTITSAGLLTGSAGAAVTGASTFTASSATTVPVTVTGAASQTADLQDWVASGPTTVASIDPNGSLTTGGARVISVTTPTISSNAVTLDGKHEVYIIGNNASAVTINGPSPSPAIGTVIYIVNESTFTTSGVAAVPYDGTSPVTWQLIYLGGSWTHVQ